MFTPLNILYRFPIPRKFSSSSRLIIVVKLHKDSGMINFLDELEKLSALYSVALRCHEK